MGDVRDGDVFATVSSLGDNGLAGAMAKMHATEAAQLIIDRAMQLHGGRGVLSGEIVEQLYRDVRPLRIYEGTTEIQKLILGGSFAKAPPSTG